MENILNKNIEKNETVIKCCKSMEKEMLEFAQKYGMENQYLEFRRNIFKETLEVLIQEYVDKIKIPEFEEENIREIAQEIVKSVSIDEWVLQKVQIEDIFMKLADEKRVSRLIYYLKHVEEKVSMNQYMELISKRGHSEEGEADGKAGKRR